MKTALLLVDIQNDYFPGGKMEVEGSLEAGLRARQLLAAFRQRQLPLIHVQHVSLRPGASFFLPHTDGAKIHESVYPLEGELIFQKHYPNSFRDTELLVRLHDKQIRRLVICGMMTHMCIDATTRAAFDHGFDCWVAEDACATRALSYKGRSIAAQQVQLAFLAALNTVYARILGTDEIIAQLSTDC